MWIERRLLLRFIMYVDNRQSLCNIQCCPQCDGSSQTWRAMQDCSAPSAEKASLEEASSRRLGRPSCTGPWLQAPAPRNQQHRHLQNLEADDCGSQYTWLSQMSYKDSTPPVSLLRSCFSGTWNSFCRAPRKKQEWWIEIWHDSRHFLIKKQCSHKNMLTHIWVVYL